MALSSSSNSMSNNSDPSGFEYDVFLSFRGQDNRKAFTDHLYTELKRTGIHTFRDDDAMERGKLLKPELEKAIQQSQVLVIVFSKGYATSKWCLDEVLMIMEEYEKPSSKHEVIPVFYNVEPSDVRHQTGCFEEAFKGYDDMIRMETDGQKKKELWDKVKAWRASLKKAGSLTGMVLADGYEAKFISNIVNDIRKKVNYNELYIKGKLVGVKEYVAGIESWLQDPSPDSTFLVVDGMGGIGKTTIAKCIYNMNYREYDGSCFLAKINETSIESNGIVRLQSRLLSKILKSEKKERVSNEYEGTSMLEKAICNKKVLLVLDDVATFQQLDALLGKKMFHQGSKVIITSRGHAWLSTAFKVPPMVQTIRTLSNADSVELFSLYAFPQNQPIEPYYDQSKLSQVTEHCGGLPLALELLGLNLRGKSIAQWEDTMSKLEKYPLAGIQKVLQFSYDSLEDNSDKDVFLHIACFFVGEDEDVIVKVLAECNLYPVIGIKNLNDRSLLYIEDGKVGMHQLIREMGKEVVRLESPKDPGERSRLCEHEDCINVLQENAGTKKVEGFRLDMQQGNEANFEIGSLEKMMNLMLLQLSYVTFSGKYTNWPKKLRLLRWHGFYLESTPGDIPLEKLVVLDMRHSKLKRVWDSYKRIESLKILNLSYSVELINTPNFHGLPGLESLILKGCTSLIAVDESIACLDRLVLLDLSNCTSLRNVPCACLPRSLTSLQMSGCQNLGAVSRFQFSYSTSLHSFQLKKLNISDCNLFDNSFPNDWSILVSLTELNIDGNKITYLPKCIQSLPRLETFHANRCLQIQSIIGLPKTVSKLIIQHNNSLEKVLQFPQDRNTLVYAFHSPKLYHIEGWYKCRSIDKVERKVTQKLGLGRGSGLDYCKQKVLFEYGIFSTFVDFEQIPSPSYFTHLKEGPQISFKVPSHNRIISGLNLCLVFPGDLVKLRIQVRNKTKDVEWNYYPAHIYDLCMKPKGWLSVWRCGKLLGGGDEICVSIFNRDEGDLCGEEVQGCCIKLIYDEDNIEEDEGEIKEKENDYVVRASTHSAHLPSSMGKKRKNSLSGCFGGFFSSCFPKMRLWGNSDMVMSEYDDEEDEGEGKEEWNDNVVMMSQYDDEVDDESDDEVDDEYDDESNDEVDENDVEEDEGGGKEEWNDNVVMMSQYDDEVDESDDEVDDESDVEVDDEVDESDVEEDEGEIKEEGNDIVVMGEYDDEEDEGEIKEEWNDNVVIGENDDEIIRWSDRMVTDISDYVHSGRTYSFGHNRFINYDIRFQAAGSGGDHGGGFGGTCHARLHPEPNYLYFTHFYDTYRSNNC